MRVWSGALAESYDLVVVGSGGAGLLAALVAAVGGRRVLVLEKSDFLGGTTAMSGGMIWIPGNRHLDPPDDRGEVLGYLRRVTQNRIAGAVLDAFVDNCVAMVDFLEGESDVRYTALENFPDYHPEWPGGRAGGRGLEPLPCDGSVVGEALLPAIRALGVLEVSQRELEDWRRSRVPLEAPPGRVARGRALIGPLARACANRGVTLVTGAPVTRLVTTGDRITGVACEPRSFASAAVLLACGGFEWSQELISRFLPGPLNGSCSPPQNTGDGIRMGMKVGAALGNMQEAWWQPQVNVPGDVTDGVPRNRFLGLERTAPGGIIVNRAGRRFINEAHNYNDVTKPFHLHDPATGTYANLPAYLIVDHGHVSRYGFFGFAAGDDVPEWLTVSTTIAGLAERLGVNAEGLVATVERFNRSARLGEDPDFHRGESVYERYIGDGQATHPALGPVDERPFYAVEVLSGAIGTKGGLLTTTDGRVLDAFGDVIGGLFAAGNTTAHPMGPGYPGPGGTLGPGMTTAYLAARRIVSEGSSGENAPTEPNRGASILTTSSRPGS